MPHLEIETKDRKRIDDIVHLVKTATEQFPSEAKQVLVIELLRMFRKEVDELRSTKHVKA